MTSVAAAITGVTEGIVWIAAGITGLMESMVLLLAAIARVKALER
jgi:hypothetical protein